MPFLRRLVKYTVGFTTVGATGVVVVTAEFPQTRSYISPQLVPYLQVSHKYYAKSKDLFLHAAGLESASNIDMDSYWSTESHTSQVGRVIPKSDDENSFMAQWENFRVKLNEWNPSDQIKGLVDQVQAQVGKLTGSASDVVDINQASSKSKIDTKAQQSQYVNMKMVDKSTPVDKQAKQLQSVDIKSVDDFMKVLSVISAEVKNRHVVEYLQSHLQKMKDLSLQQLEQAKKGVEKLKDQVAVSQLEKQVEQLNEDLLRMKNVIESQRLAADEFYQEVIRLRLQDLRVELEKEYQEQMKTRLSMVKKQFDRRVRQMVEVERDGRLAKLEELQTKLSQLEKVASANSEDFVSVKNLLQMIKASYAGNDMSIVYVSNSKTEQKDQFIQQLVKDAKLKEKQIPDLTVLQGEFAHVKKEVEKYQFAKSDGGLLSLFVSYLLSYLTFSKDFYPTEELVKQQNRDTSSLLAMANRYIHQGKTVDALKCLYQLEGWSFEVAQDFVLMLEKRAEYELLQKAQKAHVALELARNSPLQ
ncbi:hypothetical protein MIR68_005605 [Amoeboaphelidium protococcarum]|nr:hypothetical protein MIR68_005605 [Amoeboaphelidium protococcarum]